MKKIYFTIVTASILAFTGCKETKKNADSAVDSMEKEMENMEETAKEMEESTMDQTITLAMNSASDSGVKGDVTFTQNGEEVMMMAKFTGLQAGNHAIHLHETADCSAHDGKSAGGHWNPTNEKHGKWGDQEGYHKGDIGNFVADEDGNASVEFSTDEWCMDCDDETKNIVGRAVIVHQGKDDFTSQPSGDAGARVACTAIIN
ncbi:superoxide dismutase family protein [Cytophaga sp. FL35]|uniref:superoxide dismutase family protein n=1 Tax=Cytophaga sp. FL35 TaxID=1904456 RepID=UPI001653E529|nr:superoxide dismutase family protein [Cytophaga sp. FL35]MBC6996884.1 superoxide dismutase family protein [Cytophaga sp. FL35]